MNIECNAYRNGNMLRLRYDPGSLVTLDVGHIINHIVPKNLELWHNEKWVPFEPLRIEFRWDPVISYYGNLELFSQSELLPERNRGDFWLSELPLNANNYEQAVKLHRVCTENGIPTATYITGDKLLTTYRKFFGGRA